VRDHDVVIAQAVDEHERAPQTGRIRDERHLRVVRRFLIRVPEVTLRVVRVIEAIVGHGSTGDGDVEHVGTAQHREGGQEPAE
jgi:hypothetical protein